MSLTVLFLDIFNKLLDKLYMISIRISFFALRNK
jgi:hypothetical protein